MENGTLSTIYFSLDISGPLFNFHFSFLMQKNYFPLLSFPGKLKTQAALARALRKTAADRDKNNYSSICLPRDTLLTRPTPFPYELLHFHSPALTIKSFTTKTSWLYVLTQAHMFHHTGRKQILYTQDGRSALLLESAFSLNTFLHNFSYKTFPAGFIYKNTHLFLIYVTLSILHNDSLVHQAAKKKTAHCPQSIF